MSNWAEKLFQFYTNLKPPEHLPDGIEWLYPQKKMEVQRILSLFLKKFYSDTSKRILLLGINPGRHGAGITGINFTAPKQLAEYCSIENSFKGSELSAEFIYQMMHVYGGVKEFYSKFFIGSVCPLGFVQNGKNLNYYDNKVLLEAVEPFIVTSLSQLISFNVNKRICICIGGEKNFNYLLMLNKRYNWFEQIISVPHPRFIMQYKRKHLHDFINLYLKALNREELKNNKA
jgi:hypothetical protein